MNLQRSTRHGLHAALELARAWERGAVTAAEVAARHDLPQPVVAKAFQQLVRRGLARGTRGVRGGYVLARPPRQVTVLDVVEAFEEAPAPGRRLLHDPAIDSVLDEVDEVVRSTFASITLSTLAS